ncbi:protein prenyltransferase alpha subunit repeat-containing protein tempura [Anticarsia gemmatalis]|uniref:protein prenyltransferase alpha subunit repeat-containing protein tempura n=1 Tax=Anticarsia gemmatalis TaxID=129554 RepID=UPI003F75FA82
MDEDKFALVEKILKDVDNVMSKNAELNAFDIVPVESNNQNKSPVLHLENCLGLESWCVKHVYMYCYSELMDKYLSKPKRRISKPSSMNSERLNKLLNVTLLLNPEIPSLWNKRREMVLKSLLEKSVELQFTRLVLSRKPKCNDAFAYRRWLLEAIFRDETVQSNYIEDLVNEDLTICELAAYKCANNYHSWNHRMWLLKTLKNIRKQFDLNFLYIKEYGFSERWSSNHVSDFSCFHYRQFCINNIFTISQESWSTLENSVDVNLRKNLASFIVQNYPNDAVQVTEENIVSYSDEKLINLLLGYAVKNCNCLQNNALESRKLEILCQEFALNNELLRFYKYHETLWYHRRFIAHEVITLIYEHFDLVRQNGALVKNVCRKCNKEEIRQKQAKIVRYDSNRIYSSILFNILLSHEKKFVEERRNDCDTYADRHEKFLKYVEGLNNVI